MLTHLKCLSVMYQLNSISDTMNEEVESLWEPHTSCQLSEITMKDKNYLLDAT